MRFVKDAEFSHLEEKQDVVEMGKVAEEHQKGCRKWKRLQRMKCWKQRTHDAKRAPVKQFRN